jgi:hypothetical protein
MEIYDYGALKEYNEVGRIIYLVIVRIKITWGGRCRVVYPQWLHTSLSHSRSGNDSKLMNFIRAERSEVICTCFGEKKNQGALKCFTECNSVLTLMICF